MDHGRTGARYRFRVPTPGSSLAASYLINAFVALFAVAMLLGAAAFGITTLGEATAQEGVLRRLTRSPSSDDIARGRNWGRAVLRTADHRPVCYIEHQHYVSGKNGGWRTDGLDWVGQEPTLELGTATYGLNLRAVTFDPLEPRVTDDASRQRSLVRFDPGGRLRDQCLDDGAPVFADVCFSRHGHTIACSATERTTLTLGGGLPTARIRTHASDAASGLAFTTLAFALLALYGWRAARAGAIVDTLAAWSPLSPPARGSFWRGLAGATVAALAGWIALAAAPTRTPHYVGGYAFATVVLAAIAAGLVWAFDRRLTLTRALAPVDAAETMRLAHVGPGHAELVARVKADAPTVSFPGLPPCAFVRVVVKRFIHRGRQQSSELLRAAGWPARVPIEDASGEGLLELSSATLDLRACFFRATGADARELLAQLSATPFGRASLDRGPTDNLEVEVSYLEPGESVYLLGGVRRVLDPRADASYRALETRPVVADDQGRLVVHAGHEGTLVRSLRRERGYLLAAGGLLAATSAALVAACAWLLARA
jgi:hypothetical protein